MLPATAAATLLGTSTLAQLPAPDGFAATDGTSTIAVDVTWSPVDGAVGYRVYRAGEGVAFEEIVSTTETLHRDTGAAIGVPYQYRVEAFDAAETSAPSDTDGGWRNTVAPAPFEASDGTVPGGVELSWLASEGAVSYRVYRINGNGNAPPQQIGETEETSFLVESLPPGQVRTYTARAVTPAGLSDFAEPDSGFGGVPAPQDLRASDGQFSRWVMLRWRPVPQSSVYRVLRAAEGEDEVEVGTSNGPVYKDQTATPGTIYTYRVAAVLGDGVSETSEPDTGWRGLPRPVGLSASDGTSTTQIDLSWPAMPGVTGYRLLQRIPGSPWQVLAELDATSFVDTVSPPGVQVHYRLLGLVGELESRPSAPETGWRNVEAPTGLSASDGTYADRVEVVWNASTEAAVFAYDVYRRLATDPEGLLIARVESEDGSLFEDFEIAPGVIGTYWIRAVTRPGSSEGSDSDTGFRAGESGLGASIDGGSAGAADRPNVLGTGPVPRAETLGPARGGRADIGPERSAGSKGGSPNANPTPTFVRPDAPQGRESHVVEDAAIASSSAGADPDCEELRWRLEVVLAFEAMGRLGDTSAEFGVALSIELGSSTAADAPDPCAIWQGDLDGDGLVDATDLEAFLEAIEVGDRGRGDLDRDGVIGPRDLERMLERFDASLATR